MAVACAPTGRQSPAGGQSAVGGRSSMVVVVWCRAPAAFSPPRKTNKSDQNRSQAPAWAHLGNGVCVPRSCCLRNGLHR